MRNVPSLETIFHDYAPKGVAFYYLYKALAHPELNGYVNPVTLDERLMHIREAKRTLGTKIPWLADTMENELKHAVGNRPNSEYLIDPKGVILSARTWSDPETLRRELAEYVGPVENPTTPADLNMETAPAPKHAPTGIVPRIEKRGAYRTLTSIPQIEKTNEPFYVKLRAEAERGLVSDGKGKLYLAFLLDPLYGVHWNNLAPPVDVELFPPDGAVFSQTKLTGPDPEEDADADPREFLIDIELNGATAAVPMKFRYYACTEKWCRPVTQEYLITWDVNQDAGRVRGPGGRGGEMIDRIFEMDLDGDERLSRQEAPERMQERWEQMDANSDGFVDRTEMAAMGPGAGRGPGRGPGGGPGRRGARGPRMLDSLMERDANGDGKLSREELPEQIPARAIERMDANSDGFVDAEEIEAMRGRGRRGPGQR